MRRGEEDNSFELRGASTPSYRQATGDVPAVKDYQRSPSPYPSPALALGNISQKLRASRLPVPTRLRRYRSSESLPDAHTVDKALSQRRSSLEHTSIHQLNQGSRARRPSSASVADQRRSLSNSVCLNNSLVSSDGSRIPRLSRPFREVMTPLSRSLCSPSTPTDRLRQRLLRTPPSDASRRNQPLGLCTAAGVGAKKFLGKSASASNNAGLPVRRGAIRTRSFSTGSSHTSSIASQPSPTVVFGERATNEAIQTSNQIAMIFNKRSHPQVQDGRTEFIAKSSQMSVGKLGITSRRCDSFQLRSLVNQKGGDISSASALSNSSDMTVVISNRCSPSGSQDSGFKSVKDSVFTPGPAGSGRRWSERSQRSSVSEESSIFTSLDDNDSIFWHDDYTDQSELSGNIFSSPPVRRASYRSHITRSSFAEATEDLEQLMSAILPENLDDLAKSQDSHINLRQTRTPYCRDQNMTARHLAKQKSLTRITLKKQLTVKDEPVRDASNDMEVKAAVPAHLTPIRNHEIVATSVTGVEHGSPCVVSPFASRLPRLQKSSYFKLKAATAIREIKASGFTPDAEQRALEDNELVVMDTEEHRRMVQELKLLKTMLLKLKRQLMNNKEDGIAVQQQLRQSSNQGEVSQLKHLVACQEQTIESLQVDLQSLLQDRKNGRHQHEMKRRPPSFFHMNLDKCEM